MVKNLSYSRLSKFVDSNQHGIWHTYHIDGQVRFLTLISDANMVVFSLVIPDNYRITPPSDSIELTSQERGLTFQHKRKKKHKERPKSSNVDDTMHEPDMHSNIGDHEDDAEEDEDVEHEEVDHEDHIEEDEEVDHEDHIEEDEEVDHEDHIEDNTEEKHEDVDHEEDVDHKVEPVEYTEDSDELVDPFGEIEEIDPTDSKVDESRPPSPIESLREAESESESDSEIQFPFRRKKHTSEPPIINPSTIIVTSTSTKEELKTYMQRFNDVLVGVPYGAILSDEYSITYIAGHDKDIETFYRVTKLANSTMYPNLSQIYVAVDLEAYFENCAFVSYDIEAIYQRIHAQIRKDIREQTDGMAALQDKLSRTLHSLTRDYESNLQYTEQKIQKYMQKFTSLRRSRVKLVEKMRDVRKHNLSRIDRNTDDSTYADLQSKLKNIDEDLNTIQKFVINSRSFINSFSYTADRQVRSVYFTLSNHLDTLCSMLEKAE